MGKAFDEVREQGAMQKAVEIVKGIMQKKNWSVDQALEIIDVSEEEKEYIIDALKKM